MLRLSFLAPCVGRVLRDACPVSVKGAVSYGVVKSLIQTHLERLAQRGTVGRCANRAQEACGRAHPSRWRRSIQRYSDRRLTPSSLAAFALLPPVSIRTRWIWSRCAVDRRFGSESSGS